MLQRARLQWQPSVRDSIGLRLMPTAMLVMFGAALRYFGAGFLAKKAPPSGLRIFSTTVMITEQHRIW